MTIVSVTAPRPENPPCWDVILPNVWGFRKSTTEDGGLKNGYLNGAVKSTGSVFLCIDATIFTGSIYDHPLSHAQQVKGRASLMLRAIAAARKQAIPLPVGM